MSYRQSPAFRAAFIAARAQRRAMRHRVATLDNTRAAVVVIRTRREESRAHRLHTWDWLPSLPSVRRAAS